MWELKVKIQSFRIENKSCRKVGQRDSFDCYLRTRLGNICSQNLFLPNLASAKSPCATDTVDVKSEQGLDTPQKTGEKETRTRMG